MIAVRHFMESFRRDDGPRQWVEIGLTADLQEWCNVDLLVCEFGPPRILWEWYDERPGAGRCQVLSRAYRRWLLRGPHHPSLEALAQLAADGKLTLLHQCADAKHNTATVLRDVMEELAVCPQSFKWTGIRPLEIGA